MIGESIRRKYQEQTKNKRCSSQTKENNIHFQENFFKTNITKYNDKIRNQKDSKGNEVNTPTTYKRRGFRNFRLKVVNLVAEEELRK